MTILITAATGKTSRRVLAALAGHPVLLASRAGNSIDGSPGVAFDWEAPDAWEAVFSHPQAQKSPISAVYLVPHPTRLDALALLQPFIELAHSHGVRRFVLLSSTATDEGGPVAGQVHQYLRELHDREGIEWAVLRASWFMENFSELQHYPTILKESAIYSAAGDGKMPFVAAKDIAAVAARALTDATPHNRAHFVTGSELLSYDDAAAIFSEVLGRPVRHVRMTEQERADSFVTFGLSAPYAHVLAGLDTRIARGDEAVESDDVERVTGRPPVHLRDWVVEHRAVWAPV